MDLLATFAATLAVMGLSLAALSFGLLAGGQVAGSGCARARSGELPGVDCAACPSPCPHEVDER
jgi:hypothetical protein